MARKCELCQVGFVEFVGIEHIPETSNDPETGEEIRVIEVYSCSSCDYCGELHHTLIATEPACIRCGLFAAEEYDDDQQYCDNCLTELEEGRAGLCDGCMERLEEEEEDED